MSLRLKLTLLNLLLIFVVGSILTIFAATYQKRDLLQEKMLRAHSLLDNLVVQNREALILQDRFALEISSKRFLKNQDILFLLVEFEDGQIFVTDKSDKQALQILAQADESEFIFEKQPVKVLQAPVIVKSKPVGRYVLGLSLASLQEKIAQIIGKAILVASMVTLAAMLFAFFVTHHMLQPISDISEFARDLGSGNLGRQLKLKSKDEIGRLAEVMNWMSKELLEAQNDLIKKHRLEQEFEIAQNIQQQFLPKEKITVPNVRYDIYFQPARQVGGDAYDFFELSDGKVGCMVADVAGKGIEGALGMIIICTMVRTEISRGLNDPLEIMRAVNSGLLERLPGTMFVTMAFAVFDPKNNMLSLVSAGHPEMYRIGSHETINLFEDNAGVPLGIAATELWETGIAKKEVEFKEGESLLIYTDGVTETFNSEGELFGDQRLLSFLDKNRELDPPELIKGMIAQLDAFRGQTDMLDDDITILVMKRS